MAFQKRYYFFAGSFLLTLLLYIDRVCISTARDSIAEDLLLTEIQTGWMLASFALGYALFQVPVGSLGDRYGPRKILFGIITLWSLFTALTGAAWNFISILLTRFTFGAAEAGAFPNISRAAFSWIPMKERGIFQGINFSGSRLGAALALPLVAVLIELVGWRLVFYLFGIIGVIFAVLFFILFRDTPEEHPALSEREKDHIINHRQKQSNSSTSQAVSPMSFFRSKAVWLAMGQYIGSNFIFFFTLTWLFPYLKQRFGLDMLTTGFMAMLPLLAGALGNWTSGFMVDYIYQTGRWKLSRQIPAIIGFLLALIGILLSLYMTSVSGVIFGLSIAVFGADMTLSPSWSFCIDIGKNNAGAVTGMMNMAGNLGAFTTALAFPYLQAWTGSNDPFFYIAALLAGLSIIMWLFMDSTKKLDYT